ncbi:PREDICTED: probable receptor-like protein kinase At5g47070 isoform X1 [Camelina sativa]|uniref:Probable receptor-like protein kinase At5g47070 isoform X1 n=1 Tax=Camelina sativa TaxID=90675 RepID=A0ABM0WEQ5_CAMSA|nr:PREDICTED: probable receptor-like protein kinase At5g47070 isoform X1 [Camelina sativa]
MKCFHFTNGDKRGTTTTTIDEGGGGGGDSVVSRASRLSWARSLSVASSSTSDPTRRSEFDSDWSLSPERIGFPKPLSQRWIGGLVAENDLKVFTFKELKLATKGFNRGLLIGEGGFGCVYRGVVDVSDSNGFDSKIHVAVKQLNRQGLQGHKEWINEVNFLGVVNHPNLVKLVGYCADDDERGMQRLLVYELMCNKSLEDHLVGRVVSVTLPWMTRLKIAQDAAQGLAYLHEEMDFQLIFRDFKSSNILLDEGFGAKLSDFGLARQGPPEGLGHVSTSVVGTVGYAAPEYVQTGKLTAKSDVWSFGVVLYELITGRRAVDRNRPRGEQKLLEWVKPYVSDSKKFHVIVDPRLEGQYYCMKSVQRVAALANKCLMKQPKSRPRMSEVVSLLGRIIDEEAENAPPPVADETEEIIKAEVNGESEPELKKQGSYYRQKVLDLRDKMNLNKSLSKLDWRNWTPGLVRTW